MERRFTRSDAVGLAAYAYGAGALSWGLAIQIRDGHDWVLGAIGLAVTVLMTAVGCAFAPSKTKEAGPEV